MVKKIIIFFLAAVLEIGREAVTWHRSRAVKPEIKRGMAYLSDRLSYKLFIFNMLSENRFH